MKQSYYFLKPEKSLSSVEGSGLEFNHIKDAFVDFFECQLRDNRFIGEKINFFPFQNVIFKARGNFDIYIQALGMTLNIFFISENALELLHDAKTSEFQYWPIKLKIRGNIKKVYMIAFVEDAFYCLDFLHSTFSIRTDKGSSKLVKFKNINEYYDFCSRHRETPWFEFGPKPYEIKFQEHVYELDLFYSRMFSSRLVVTHKYAKLLEESGLKGIELTYASDLPGFADFKNGLFHFPGYYK